VKIGHALNGIAYTTHLISGPMAAPFATYRGSLEDAIKGAQRDIMKLQLQGATGRVAFALTGMGDAWMAHTLFDNPTLVRAIDNGAGHGGIASIEFTSVSRSLGALVTSAGSLIPSQYPAQGTPKA
jgi:hypothetical protein